MNPASPESGARPQSSERLWVLLLIGLFFLFNLATYNHYPAVWCDEVWFSEPPVNLVKNGSFTTTTWQWEPANTFPTVNCPLYCVALVPWLAVTGTSVLAIRSFNYALFGLGVFGLWAFCKKFGVVKTAPARLALVLLLHAGYGMSFAYRCSRPDILGLDVLLLLLWSFAIARPRPRALALAGLSAVLVWIGFQVALFAGLAGFLGWVMLRRAGFKDLVWMALGMAVGMGSLLLFLQWRGLLAWFLPPLVGLMGKHYAHTPHLGVVASVLKVIAQSCISYVDDFSTLVLTVGLVVLLAAAWKKLAASTRRLMLFCLALLFAVPLLFNVVGHFAFYYSGLRYVPSVIAFCAAFAELGRADAGSPRWLKPACVAAMLLAALVGLPLRLAVVLASSHIVPRAETQKIIAAQIRPDDVVLADHCALFEAKNVARVVYDPYYSSELLKTPVPGHPFTAEEKRSMTVLVIRPEEAEFLKNLFGGEWKTVTEPFGDSQDFSRLARLPVVGSRLAHYATQPQTERHPVQIFRRVAQ